MSEIQYDAATDRLRDIRSITDVTLGQLEVDDLLVELLDRVRDILVADTAAILLLDEGSEELEARAARGIEEEVRQGVRVPLRKGFAGRIAAEKRPVALDRVDHTTVSNPILWGKGIHAMLGVPLLSGGQVLGVLHVGRLDGQDFTRQDSEVLEIVAERVAGAIQSRQAQVERAAADVLQRSLLPSALPAVDGLELAARYVPAERLGVGGDWYDVFTVPSGDLWVVTGDVAGHGLAAAAVMGRIRTAIRSYALAGHQPDEVLALADRNLAHFDPDKMATVVCAASKPPFDEVRLSRAGHLPPVLARPAGPAALVELEAGLPLGVDPETSRRSTTIRLSPGTMLFFYTDGLVERRDDSLDVRLKQLCAAVSAHEPLAVCHRVMGLLVGAHEADDDIAVLAMRRSTGPESDGPGLTHHDQADHRQAEVPHNSAAPTEEKTRSQPIPMSSTPSDGRGRMVPGSDTRAALLQSLQFSPSPLAPRE